MVNNTETYSGVRRKQCDMVRAGLLFACLCTLVVYTHGFVSTWWWRRYFPWFASSSDDIPYDPTIDANWPGDNYTSDVDRKRCVSLFGEPGQGTLPFGYKLSCDIRALNKNKSTEPLYPGPFDCRPIKVELHGSNHPVGEESDVPWPNRVPSEESRGWLGRIKYAVGYLLITLASQPIGQQPPCVDSKYVAAAWSSTCYAESMSNVQWGENPQGVIHPDGSWDISKMASDGFVSLWLELELKPPKSCGGAGSSVSVWKINNTAVLKNDFDPYHTLVDTNVYESWSNTWFLEQDGLLSLCYYEVEVGLPIHDQTKAVPPAVAVVIAAGWVTRVSIMDHLLVSHLLMSLLPAVAVRSELTPGGDRTMFMAMQPALQGAIRFSSEQIPVLMKADGFVNGMFDADGGSTHKRLWEYVKSDLALDQLLPPKLRRETNLTHRSVTRDALDLAWDVVYSFTLEATACNGAAPVQQDATAAFDAVFTPEIRDFPGITGSQLIELADRHPAVSNNYWAFAWALVLYHGSFVHYVVSDSMFWSLSHVNTNTDAIYRSLIRTVVPTSSGTRGITRAYADEALYGADGGQWSCVKEAHKNFKTALDTLEDTMRSTHEKGTARGTPHKQFLVPYPSVVGAGALY